MAPSPLTDTLEPDGGWFALAAEIAALTVVPRQPGNATPAERAAHSAAVRAERCRPLTAADFDRMADACEGGNGRLGADTFMAGACREEAAYLRRFEGAAP